MLDFCAALDVVFGFVLAFCFSLLLIYLGSKGLHMIDDI
jgi:hypothetical protein